MNSEPLPYDIWITDALRTVVRRSLELVEREGLPGEHHFYIAFRTVHPGVEMPSHLKAQYPTEITIVLQNRFWDLEVGEDSFSVTLSFSGRDSRLRVPFAAVTSFADPSVKFGLQFKTFEPAPDAVAAPIVMPTSEAEPAGEPGEDAKPKKGEVITLEAFRKKN